MPTDLSSFNNDWYRPGRGLKRFCWLLTSALFFQHSLAILNSFKCFLLRLFGAKIGKGVIIKPKVNIKYPWLLDIGNYVWIGEYVWIDNLAKVTIGNNVCISQNAMLLTGNHDYKLSTFDLMTGAIILEDGVWIGAKSTVCPGITCSSHAILTVGSIATKSMEAYMIYQGNPAKPVKKREILEKKLQ